MNLSFAGCGFLGIYHIGVASCFRQYAPQLLLNKISGASAGALAACSLLCDIPLDDMVSDVLEIVKVARKYTLGPFSPKFNMQSIFRNDLERMLPDDCHKKVDGKLFVSLTRARDGKNVIVSSYKHKKDLIDVLLATTFIPFFSGYVPPKIRGIRYLDGGFSDNLPTLDENTITVSPFSGESDICPQDDSSQLFHINVNNMSVELSKENVYRCAQILFPPHPESLSKICKQGFDDALRFLHRNNLISCARCLAVQSTFTMQSHETQPSTMDSSMLRPTSSTSSISASINNTSKTDTIKETCADCVTKVRDALNSDMPEAMRKKFREAIDAANRGLFNWFFRHRTIKILCVLSLPYTLPFDIMHATVLKLFDNAPILTNSMWSVAQYFMKVAPTLMGAKISKDFVSETASSNSNHDETNDKEDSDSDSDASTHFDDDVVDSAGVSYGLQSQETRHAVHKEHGVNRTVKEDLPSTGDRTEDKLRDAVRLTEYNFDLCEIKGQTNTTSKINVNMNLDTQSTKQDDVNGASSSSQSSVLESKEKSLENIFDLTRNKESFMTFYYTDNNTLKMTQMFDVTEINNIAASEKRKRNLEEDGWQACIESEREHSFGSSHETSSVKKQIDVSNQNLVSTVNADATNFETSRRIFS